MAPETGNSSTPAGAGAVPPLPPTNPCKISRVVAPELTFQIKASDMPVICGLSDTSIGVEIIRVDVIDNNPPNSNKGPLPGLPGTSFTLRLQTGDYTVYPYVSPAREATTDLPLGGKILNLVESCAGQTVLCVYSDETPAPHFRLRVV